MTPFDPSKHPQGKFLRHEKIPAKDYELGHIVFQKNVSLEVAKNGARMFGTI